MRIRFQLAVYLLVLAGLSALCAYALTRESVEVVAELSRAFPVGKMAQFTVAAAEGERVVIDWSLEPCSGAQPEAKREAKSPVLSMVAWWVGQPGEASHEDMAHVFQMGRCEDSPSTWQEKASPKRGPVVDIDQAGNYQVGYAVLGAYTSGPVPVRLTVKKIAPSSTAAQALARFLYHMSVFLLLAFVSLVICLVFVRGRALA